MMKKKFVVRGVKGMVVSLSLAAYIVFAGILYYKDRKDMALLERYITQNVPVSEGMLKLSFLLMFLALPVVQIISWIGGLLGKDKDIKEQYDDDPDMKAFLEEFYPEKLHDVDKATIVLDTENEIEEFVHRLGRIFDRELAPIEQDRILTVAEQAEKTVEKNCQAHVLYHGEVLPIFFKISRCDDADENFNIHVFARSDAMDEIEVVMTAYMDELNK